MNVSAIVVLPLFGVGLGILILVFIGNGYRVSQKMDEWQVTQGVITKFDIKQTGAAFTLDVQYRYLVLGIEYIGLRVNVAPKQTYKREVAQKWISQYAVGKKIDVFYDPEKPRLAVLEKGFFWKDSLLVIGAALFLILFNGFILFIPYL